MNDQPLMKSSDGNSENNFDDSENSVNHKPVIKRQKSREHHSSSGSSNKSHISSRTSSKNHSRYGYFHQKVQAHMSFCNFACKIRFISGPIFTWDLW